MPSINTEILTKHNVTVDDLYLGAFQIKMKAEELLRDGKNAHMLYKSEYHIVSALTEMGYVKAMLLLAEMLQGGHVPDIDENTAVHKAIDLWEEAGKAGESRAYTNLGLLYLHQPIPGGGSHFADIPYDSEKGFAYLLKAAQENDSKAPRHVGLCYRDGIGVVKDEEKAYFYFSEAARRNDSTGRFLKAECLYNGKGVKQNQTEALTIMRQLINEKAHDAARAEVFLKEHIKNHSNE